MSLADNFGADSLFILLVFVTPLMQRPARKGGGDAH